MKKSGSEIFLKKGKYPLIRDVKGLGWLVLVNYNDNMPVTTIIKHKDGVKHG
jgi:hypothetical protein